MIEVILTLALLGFIAWLIFTYIPMAEPIRSVALVIMVILLVLYLLEFIHRGGVGNLSICP